MAALSLNRIGNLILPVSDLGRSVKFYCDTLRIRQVGSVPGDFAFLDAGSLTLALHQSNVSVPRCNCEVSFQVDDIHATYEELRAKGVAFRVPPRVVTEDADRQLFAADFRDPDGHVLSIAGWVKK